VESDGTSACEKGDTGRGEGGVIRDEPIGLLIEGLAGGKMPLNSRWESREVSTGFEWSPELGGHWPPVDVVEDVAESG